VEVDELPRVGAVDRCARHWRPASSCSDSTASSHGWSAIEIDSACAPRDAAHRLLTGRCVVRAGIRRPRRRADDARRRGAGARHRRRGSDSTAPAAYGLQPTFGRVGLAGAQLLYWALQARDAALDWRSGPRSALGRA
jgi:hypothetical protein